MPTEEEIVKEVAQEVKQIGTGLDGLKKLQETMQAELKEARSLQEELKGKAITDPVLTEKLDALTKSVGEKQSILEKSFTERMDELEKKTNRPNLDPSSDDRELKGFELFHTSSLAMRGQLKVGVDRGDLPVADIKSYAKVMDTYLRRDQQVLSSTESKTMLVGSDPDGGYLVTPKMSNRILSYVYESSPMRDLATVETISTDAIEYPTDDGEVGAGWVGETENRPETSTPRLGVQRIVVHEVFAQPKVTQKLLEDASIDVETWLARKIADKFSRMENTAFIAGDGIKKPRGILSYPSGTADTNYMLARGTVEQVPSGTVGAITSDAIVGMTFLLKEAYQANATWLMRRATVPALMLLKDGQGRYIWSPGMSVGAPSSLMGHAVRNAADMPAIASNALSIALGDWRQAYVIVDRLGITTLRDPYTAKPFVLFYTRKRVGGDVVNFEAYKVMKIA